MPDTSAVDSMSFVGDMHRALLYFAMSFPLDHIVHLSAPGELPKTIEHFRDLGFEVLPGGKHADGLTENALVVLADGIYLELIQFTKSPSEYASDSDERHKRESHWWASMKEGGWIDFSLGDSTGVLESSVADTINARARDTNIDVSYDAGIEGGRIKPDGEAIRWVVTFPSEHLRRGGVPFFCKDLTPRSRRVPSYTPISTAAPSTGPGTANCARIGALTLMTLKDKYSIHSAALATVLGQVPQSKGEDGDDGAVWMLDSPTASAAIKLELIAAKTNEEKEWVQAVGGIGVLAVTLAIRHQQLSAGQDSGTAVGQIRWIDVDS